MYAEIYGEPQIIKQFKDIKPDIFFILCDHYNVNPSAAFILYKTESKFDELATDLDIKFNAICINGEYQSLSMFCIDPIDECYIIKEFAHGVVEFEFAKGESK